MFMFKYLAVLVAVVVGLNILGSMFRYSIRVRIFDYIVAIIVCELITAFVSFSFIFSLYEGFLSMWTIPFLPLFILDGYLLWAVLFLFAGLTISTIEYEKPGWCSFLIVVALFVVEYYTRWHPISFAIVHPLDAFFGVMAYFAAGTVWVITKWLVHIHLGVAEKFNAIKGDIIAKLVEEYKSSEEFLGSRPQARRTRWEDQTAPVPVGEAPPAYVPIDGRYVKTDLTLTEDGQKRVFEIGASQLGERELPLQVRHHKAELYMWWICWPLSMAWTAAITLGLNRAFWFIYNQIGGLLQTISNRAFKLD